MKKLLSLILVTVVILSVFTGCYNTSGETDATTSPQNLPYNTESSDTSDATVASEEYLLELVPTVDDEDEMKYILSQNPSEKVQIAIARVGTYEGLNALLNYEKLTPEGLIAVCEEASKATAKINMTNASVRELFVNAIKRATFSPEQEEKLAKLNRFAILKGLILHPNLSGSGLVAVCKVAYASDSSINIGSKNVEKWIIDAINRTSLTSEQEVELANLNHFAILKGLLLRSNLSGNGLVAICEVASSINSSINIESNNVEELIINAVEHTSLTPEQELEIARFKTFIFHKALLLRSNLTYNTLLYLSNNTYPLNMNSSNVQEWFETATARIATTLTDEEKLALIKTDINGINKVLMPV